MVDLSNIVGASSSGTTLTDGSVKSNHVADDAINADHILDSAKPDICFLKDTKILLKDSEYKNIKDLSENDILKSSNIQDLDNNNVDIEYLLNWYTKDFKNESSNTIVKELYKHSTEQYYIINNELKLTPEHLLFVKKNDIYEWYSAKTQSNSPIQGRYYFHAQSVV